MFRFSPGMPPPLIIWFTAGLLILGAAGGELAALINVPLPWMMGSLAISAILVAVAPHRFPANYVFPLRFRMVFIAIIGVMIGAQVDADMLGEWRNLAISLGGVTLFVFLAHGTNYWLFRRFGGYSRVTAFYCGTPGGVMESIAMGEEAGADIRLLTLQQFLRIILVVVSVPIGLSLLHGGPLGSSAGIEFGNPDAGPWDIPKVLVVGLVGLVVGRALRLPAGQLTGPLVATAVLSGLGWIDVNPPGWMVAAAQVVLGVSLGVRFIGITARMLQVAAGLAIASVGAMLGLGVILSVLINQITGQSVQVMILSFAPGGVTEMGLVALSLSANPAMVAFHHLYRITITVLEMSVLGRWLNLSDG
ncbi:AbrB family transcriptional regulator [Oceaniglobus ichthyenteri]|uniref:AbrB family transcriptional regulator n=1 Tax=Oceaniglobus ichthyenteri TaxID=2136177 RepID=UPI001F0BEF06|nr:AbrB family transcriptional regulator [Oceaniglobus ichthyenteri]